MNDAIAESEKLSNENAVLKHNINLIVDATQRDLDFANRLKILAPTLDLTCGGLVKGKQHQQRQHPTCETQQNFKSNNTFTVPDVNSFVPQAGSINLPFTNTNTQQRQQTSKQTQPSKQANTNKKMKTSVGVISLFVVALAFGMFVNNLSSLPPRANVVNYGTASWRTGRIILNVEKWYHNYVPEIMHEFVDSWFSLFCIEEDQQHLNEEEELQQKNFEDKNTFLNDNISEKSNQINTKNENNRENIYERNSVVVDNNNVKSNEMKKKIDL
jgi:hypothetical protein